MKEISSENIKQSFIFKTTFYMPTSDLKTFALKTENYPTLMQRPCD